MTVRNEISGAIGGTVIQAGSIAKLTITTGRREYSPMQLPPAPYAFVNRVSLLSSMDRAVAEHEHRPTLFVLSGMTGVGKSAAAAQWAHTNRDRFTGGVLHADLSDYRGERGVGVSDVVAAFLRALGVHDPYIPATRAERIALFRSRTALAPVLVLLDGVDEPAQARSVIPASIDSVVIVTTRHRLSGLVIDGAKFIDLAPLDPDDSTRLMRRMVPPQQIEDDQAAVLELVKLCAGLPVALRVASAGLARHRRWPIARLVQHLSDEGERLDRLTIEEEGGSVGHMFDLAYNDLPRDVQRLYCSLGLHPGSTFTVASAAVAVQMPEGTTERLVDSLCAANLAEDMDGDRFRFHDLIRLHARKCAERDIIAADRDAVLRRIIDWYALGAAAADLAVLGSHRWRLVDHDLTGWTVHFDSSTAMSWFEDERTNLLGSVRAAAANQWQDLVWQMCESLWAFYHSRKHYSDWIEANRLGAKAAKQAGNPIAEARMRNQLARAHIEMNDFSLALTQIDEADRLASNNERAHAVVMESRGLLYRGQERYLEAADVFRELVARQRASGDDRAFALQSYQLGDVLVRGRRADQAVPVLTDALRAMTNLDNEEMVEARVRIALGTAYHRLHDYPAAKTQLQSAVRVTSERKQSAKEAQALEELVAVAQEERDSGLFQSTAERLYTLYVEAGNPRSDEVHRWIQRGAKGGEDD